MKRLIPMRLVALALPAPAQVIPAVKNYRYNATPTPPTHLVRGEDGTLHGMNGDMIFGSTSRDGQFGGGTVFRLNTDGTGH